MIERFSDGTIAAERHLTLAAQRVHALVEALAGEPTDSGVTRLEHAFRALMEAGEEARAAGVAGQRVDAAIDGARKACRTLLLDVLMPLIARDEAQRPGRSSS